MGVSSKSRGRPTKPRRRSKNVVARGRKSRVTQAAQRRKAQKRRTQKMAYKRGQIARNERKRLERLHEVAREAELREQAITDAILREEQEREEELIRQEREIMDRMSRRDQNMRATNYLNARNRRAYEGMTGMDGRLQHKWDLADRD